MGGWRPRGSRARLGPLHLQVERYVRCPRGGLASLSRCEACNLMQGMLLGDRMEVLCAYPETVPALRLARWERMDGTQGSSAPDTTGERRDAALALATPQRSRTHRRATPRDRAGSLIFERDWPED